MVELEQTPIKDPVSGNEKEMHISYPKGGFLWNDGNIVTTRRCGWTRETVRS